MLCFYLVCWNSLIIIQKIGLMTLTFCVTIAFPSTRQNSRKRRFAPLMVWAYPDGVGFGTLYLNLNKEKCERKLLHIGVFRHCLSVWIADNLFLLLNTLSPGFKRTETFNPQILSLKMSFEARIWRNQKKNFRILPFYFKQTTYEDRKSNLRLTSLKLRRLSFELICIFSFWQF